MHLHRRGSFIYRTKSRLTRSTLKKLVCSTSSWAVTFRVIDLFDFLVRWAWPIWNHAWHWTNPREKSSNTHSIKLAVGHFVHFIPITNFGRETLNLETDGHCQGVQSSIISAGVLGAVSTTKEWDALNNADVCYCQVNFKNNYRLSWEHRQNGSQIKIRRD